MMITKFKSIENFAVFNNFNWDNTVVGTDGKMLLFDKLNIIYGRNYSGKTTLSRILRALETKTLPDKYENPKFEVLLNDNSVIDETTLDTHHLEIRVFNEDFVRSNLRFLSNPADGEIVPFTILGADNVKNEAEIREMEDRLGSNEPDNERGLYLQLKDAQKEKCGIETEHTAASQELEKKLSFKATDKQKGIKYQMKTFGDQVQNYTIKSLHQDINTVLLPTYVPLTEKDIHEYEKTIQEQPKKLLSDINVPDLSLKEFYGQSTNLLCRKIGTTSKIRELILSTALNDWVKKGVVLLEGTEKCAFCDNIISEKRWQIIHAHFDEESKKLESDITTLIDRIEKKKSEILQTLSIDKDLFYAHFHQRVEVISSDYALGTKQYIEILENVIEQLNKRREQITVTVDFVVPTDNSNELIAVFSEYVKVCKENNAYSTELDKKQQEAQDALRLQEVADFCTTIDYLKMKNKISEFYVNKGVAETKVVSLEQAITSLRSELQVKRRQSNNEEEGAQRVNAYLTDYFGHNFLMLQADKSDENNAYTRFRIFRSDKPAFNLSEGECRLISFCYFMAKLDDVDTKGKRPIIWIDDPISSLDSNHIFFVYSLILDKIVKENIFSQLFVSTHNLDFLKYLRRMYPIKTQEPMSPSNNGKNYFVIDRRSKRSLIKQMPKYLTEYATEYNYLFTQIYKCSRIEDLDDDNHYLIYNFGNTARKFFEIHLYFKYPDMTILTDKLHRFFSPDEVTAELINRLCHENSHASLERALRVGEQPEAIPAAKKIIETLKKVDEPQFDALLKSIIE
jgi:wobble nucleotide-excising tRNase